MLWGGTASRGPLRDADGLVWGPQNASYYLLCSACPGCGTGSACPTARLAVQIFTWLVLVSLTSATQFHSSCPASCPDEQSRPSLLQCRPSNG